MNEVISVQDEEKLSDYDRLKLEYTRLHEDYRHLQSEVDELKLEIKRARIFITSREKMHPDGVALYDELLK